MSEEAAARLVLVLDVWEAMAFGSQLSVGDTRE